jgi:hypothetical protein
MCTLHDAVTDAAAIGAAAWAYAYAAHVLKFDSNVKMYIKHRRPASFAICRFKGLLAIAIATYARAAEPSHATGMRWFIIDTR